MILLSSLCELWQGGDVDHGFRIWRCSNRRGAPCLLVVAPVMFALTGAHKHICEDR